jgi:malonyl-CoA O-methyltransferase
MKPPVSDPGVAIARSFSKHADSYERHAMLQKDMAEQLAQYLPCPLPDRILEVGCGTGLFTQNLIQKKYAQLYLNDISPDMLVTLQTHLQLPDNVQLICGDACQLDFKITDLITANAVFQWFENPQKAVKHLRQFLAPDGRLIFSVFGPNTLKNFRSLAKIDGPITLYPMKKWKHWLENSGFVIQQSQTEIKETFWPSALSLMKNLQQVGAVPIRKLSYREVKRLIADYERSFATTMGVSAEWEIFYISAVLT